jgi:peroxiredoxin
MSHTAVGGLAPDFSLIDPQTNTEVRLSELRGRDVLLIFFRGTWCPFCREQMAFLRDNAARLETANIAAVGVVCQNRETVKQYLEKNPLAFPLLPDESRAVAKSYGVHYWLTYEGFNLAHPSLFILDRQGVITFAHIGKNMRDLPLSRVLEQFLTFLDEANEEK